MQRPAANHSADCGTYRVECGTYRRRPRSGRLAAEGFSNIRHKYPRTFHEERGTWATPPPSRPPFAWPSLASPSLFGLCIVRSDAVKFKGKKGKIKRENIMRGGERDHRPCRRIKRVVVSQRVSCCERTLCGTGEMRGETEGPRCPPSGTKSIVYFPTTISLRFCFYFFNPGFILFHSETRY